MHHAPMPGPDGAARLKVHLPDANHVSLAGDFNGWDVDVHPMTKGADGWWHTTTPPLYGAEHTAVRVCYKYVVDGDRWLADPLNPLRVRGDSAIYVPARRPHTPVRTGRLLTGSVYVSAALGRPCRYLAYLPFGYEHSTQRMPVLYLLHGYRDGGATEWLLKAHISETLDTLISLGRVPPMIVIMPEAGDEFYADHFDGSWPLERALTQDLIFHVDAVFRTRANRRGRAIGGMSAGGFGAVKLALQYPHLFCSAHSHSGLFDVSDDRFFPEIFGAGPEAALHRQWNSPLALIREPMRTAELNLSFDCGEQDHLFEDNIAFQNALAEHGVPHTFWTMPGYHSWAVLQCMLPRALERHGAAFMGSVPLKGNPGVR